MRRLFIYLVLGMLAIAAVKSMRSGPRPPRHYAVTRPRHEPAYETRQKARQAVVEARRAMEEAGHEVRQAWHEAREELGRAYREARDEIRQAYREIVADNDDDRLPLPPPTLTPGEDAVPAREDAEGLPVPIVPGTRVTQAEARPPAPPVPAVPAVPARLASQSQSSVSGPQVCENPQGCCEATSPTIQAMMRRTIPGDICATEDGARSDAEKVLREKVGEWLAPDVPASWTPPAGLVQAMIVESKVDPHVSQRGKEYGPTYVATLTADFSPRRRAELVDTYDRDLVKNRLATLGGSLGFLLICLAAVSGYIRADEATKGYYTNRLRMVAAAGVGAAGVIFYKMVA
jgi:hypothetical protein